MSLTPEERRTRLTNLLVEVANQQRGQSAFYGNLRGLPGGFNFRRLISSIGFLARTRLTYITPAATNVEIGSEPRVDINSVLLHPYGSTLDISRLQSTTDRDRRRHHSRVRGGKGVLEYPPNPLYLMPGYCLPNTHADEKDIEFVIDSTTPRRAKSWHFYINRVGDLIVSAAIDDIVCATEESTKFTIDIALENLLLISKQDHHANNVNETTLVEAPYTTEQIATLAVLGAKLETAFLDITETANEGFVRNDDDEAYRIGNFTNEEWKNNNLPFDYTGSDFTSLFDTIDTIPDFDYATDLFRSAIAVEVLDRREIARTTISNEDTLSTQSTYLANYASISSATRALEMQDRPRVSYFINRINASTTSSNNTTSNANTVGSSTVSGATSGATAGVAFVGNNDPLVYNFRTGKWGDGNSV